MAVSWGWSGAQSDDGFTVSFKLSAPATTCRLGVSTTSFGTPTFGSYVTPDANDHVKVTISGLTANTLYYYRLEIDGTIDTAFTGECSTFPTAGLPANFTIAAATCSASDSNLTVFDDIAALRPLVFLHGGDRHYANISTNNPQGFRDIFHSCISQTRQKEWQRVVPVDYTWDDHDYGGNGSDATTASRPAANLVYRQIVPHYELPGRSGIGCQHTFDIGLIRVIVTDTRSYRSVNSLTDNRAKTMLGFEQRAWFFDVLQDAVDSGIRAIVWNNSMQWSIEEAFPGAVDTTDSWRVFDYERRLISRFMNKIGCPPVVIVSGDAHEIATRLDYQNSGMRFCIFQNAAMHGGSNSRKDYWDSGPVGGSGHYGVLSFTDDGESVLTVDYDAMEYNTVLWNHVVDLQARIKPQNATDWHTSRRRLLAAPPVPK